MQWAFIHALLSRVPFALAALSCFNGHNLMSKMGASKTKKMAVPQILAYREIGMGRLRELNFFANLLRMYLSV